MYNQNGGGRQKTAANCIFRGILEDLQQESRSALVPKIRFRSQGVLEEARPLSSVQAAIP